MWGWDVRLGGGSKREGERESRKRKRREREYFVSFIGLGREESGGFCEFWG